MFTYDDLARWLEDKKAVLFHPCNAPGDTIAIKRDIELLTKEMEKMRADNQ